MFSPTTSVDEAHIQEGMMVRELINILEDMKPTESVSSAQSILANRMGLARNRFKTIDKPMTYHIKIPAKLDDQGKVLIPESDFKIEIGRWPQWERFKKDAPRRKAAKRKEAKKKKNI